MRSMRPRNPTKRTIWTLADASGPLRHSSGPCRGNPVEVRVLPSALGQNRPLLEAARPQAADICASLRQSLAPTEDFPTGAAAEQGHLTFIRRPLRKPGVGAGWGSRCSV